MKARILKGNIAVNRDIGSPGDKSEGVICVLPLRDDALVYLEENALSENKMSNCDSFNKTVL